MAVEVDLEAVLNFIVVPVILLALTVILITHFTTKRRRYPPVITSCIPWLGCAVEFGKAPLQFIRSARARYGAVFTIHAAGQRMTFLTDREDYDVFFNSPHADFQKAVQKPVRNTASISEEDFFRYHREIHDLIKGRLAPSNLVKLTPRICRFLESAMWNEETSSGKQKELMTLVRDIIFSTVVPGLFGENVLPKTKSEVKYFLNEFVKFDLSFEHGAQLPEFLLKEWSQSKWFLLRKFQKVMQENSGNGKKEGTLMDVMMEKIARRCAPNYAVCLLWASLANAIPITFWTLACILKDKKIKEEVLEEVKEVMGPYLGKAGHLADASFADIKKLQAVERCVLEAIRLYSPGMIARQVIHPIEIKGYTVAVGDLLMISPYWAHHDDTTFPNADQFVPNRWRDKESVMENFVAFGGGRFQCPGRWFAMMEMQLFVAVMLYCFDMELVAGSLPRPSPQHVVGVPHPDSPCFVIIQNKGIGQN